MKLSRQRKSPTFPFFPESCPVNARSLASTLTRLFPTLLLVAAAFVAASAVADEPPRQIRVGMIGLDTSHCLAFSELLNKAADNPDLANCKVTLVYPKGSPDIESSVRRVPEYTVKIKALGVEVVEDLNAMISQVDAVLLETNDGRPHLEQAFPVLKAGKPLFIDKPVAGSLADALAIYEIAAHFKTPVFSSSSLRFAAAAQAVRKGSIGDVTGCDAYSPCSLEATHPDLFWYGIHGCETLFTVMGPGVQTVTRTGTKDFDLVTGVWKDGRIGTFRGIRSGGGGYGGTAFGTKGVAPVGPYDGYKPLVVEIVRFFRTGTPPVSAEETIDLYAFMEAADESKRLGYTPVQVADVIAKARTAATARVTQLLQK
jgi:predicted dehydrogenase